MSKENEHESLKAVLAKLQTILPTDEFLPLHEPLFMGNENEYVK